jgi:hypothetical protein
VIVITVVREALILIIEVIDSHGSQVTWNRTGTKVRFSFI